MKAGMRNCYRNWVEVTLTLSIYMIDLLQSKHPPPHLTLDKG